MAPGACPCRRSNRRLPARSPVWRFPEPPRRECLPRPARRGAAVPARGLQGPLAAPDADGIGPAAVPAARAFPLARQVRPRGAPELSPRSAVPQRVACGLRRREPRHGPGGILRVRRRPRAFGLRPVSRSEVHAARRRRSRRPASGVPVRSGPRFISSRSKPMPAARTSGSTSTATATSRGFSGSTTR